MSEERRSVELVIDSATAICSVALVGADGALIDERHERLGRGHAERLVPMIAGLLGNRRPDRILVDCGPGSFTGVRVGLAAARGLALGWGVEVDGYSSLALLAAMARERSVGVALLGGHGELFVQSFAGDPIAPTDALQSLAPRGAAEAIRAPLVVGSGAEALVSARGFGRALALDPRAAETPRLPSALRSLPPRPIFGRAPDAKPMK
jgi:tRNA threonylcarbamoyladenosine biosynthesis protein TsaB